MTLSRGLLDGCVWCSWGAAESGALTVWYYGRRALLFAPPTSEAITGVYGIERDGRYGVFILHSGVRVLDYGHRQDRLTALGFGCELWEERLDGGVWCTVIYCTSLIAPCAHRVDRTYVGM